MFGKRSHFVSKSNIRVISKRKFCYFRRVQFKVLHGSCKTPGRDRFDTLNWAILNDRFKKNK